MNETVREKLDERLQALEQRLEDLDENKHMDRHKVITAIEELEKAKDEGVSEVYNEVNNKLFQAMQGDEVNPLVEVWELADEELENLKEYENSE